MHIRLPSRRTIGALLWLSSLQYYLVQLVVAAAWPDTNRYSWAHNTISDLGNTVCGTYGSRPVCSPDHPLMNASFIILGFTMLLGACLLQGQVASGRRVTIGIAGIALSGIGTVLVGLFPENTVGTLHILGAALPFVIGNLSMVLLGVAAKRLPTLLRAYTIVSGLVGVTGLALFITSKYLGLGAGGMERLAAYPLSTWLIIVGGYLVLQRRKLP